MFIKGVALFLPVILCAGCLQAYDDANFRLTILIEMRWDEGDMYRTYQGTADIYLLLSEVANDPDYDDYYDGFVQEHPDELVPDYLGSVEGYGELSIEGSGSSGDIDMTFNGTAYVEVSGNLIIHPDLGQVMDVTLFGNTDETWIVHTPDGDITMPQNAPLTPVSLIFEYGDDEIELNEPWDEGTTRQVYSLAIMYDPFNDPCYEGPLPQGF
jgi:hypothetical protein